MAKNIIVKSVFKYGDYEIMRVFDRFGNWNYTLLYKGAIRKQSFDFGGLKNIAVNDLRHLMN